MKTISPAILLVLLLVTSALAQNPQNASPEMQMPSGAEPTAQTHTHAKPEHSAMEGMEMHTPESTASHVASVQEPEKPSQRTGSNTPVPDLLQQAQEMPPKRLADFEVLALKNNPTLKQAQLMTKADAGLAHQAGLWPNPAVGYQGDEIRGGVFRGGEQGGFVQQNIVLGGKLGLRRKVYEQQQRADQLAVEEQKLDVRGAVEVHFYSALALLRRIAVLRELLGIAMDAATTAHQLANVGQADAPDVLQAEVEAEQAKLEFVRAERDYIQSYQQLAAIAGDPEMPLSIVDGDL
jgi:cobalt-zinc-cadmium efflux system outer membrane protein